MTINPLDVLTKGRTLHGADLTYANLHGADLTKTT